MEPVRFPISFRDNKYCCRCGAKDSMVYEQGNRTYKYLPIYSSSSIICEACNTRYFIKWIWNEEEQDFEPFASDGINIDLFAIDIQKHNDQYKRELRFE